jgi:thiamine-monophosphate kinase
MVSITVFGAVPTGRMVRRAAARPGDLLFVSGSLGDAALGLLARTDPVRAAVWGLDAAEAAHLARRYLLPEPRLALAPAILAEAGAAMDLSDGLGLDLARMCRGSGVAAEVRLADLPLSPAARRALAADPDLMERIVGGGDDYEILAAVAPGRSAAFVAAAAAAGVAVTEVGRVTASVGADEAPRFLRPDGRSAPFVAYGFRHF